jgi:TorA maturation chaperone TorD
MPRDEGLQEAIEAAGGIGALARVLGISQPSVSTWQQVPPTRVLAVEAATGVSRSVLRPDLYPDAGVGEALDDCEAARAQEYRVLALLLGRAPTTDVLARVAKLRGDSSPLGMAHIALARAAEGATAGAVSNEFFTLFIGLGRGVFLPYASYYLTGFLHERPLARVREDMAALGIERAAHEPEPEDHIALLCETMAGLIDRQFAAAGADRRFFERHLRPWAIRFFTDLETARDAGFYRSVGAVGRLFLEIEDKAFRLDAPIGQRQRADDERTKVRS